MHRKSSLSSNVWNAVSSHIQLADGLPCHADVSIIQTPNTGHRYCPYLHGATDIHSTFLTVNKPTCMTNINCSQSTSPCICQSIPLLILPPSCHGNLVCKLQSILGEVFMSLALSPRAGKGRRAGHRATCGLSIKCWTTSIAELTVDHKWTNH